MLQFANIFTGLMVQTGKGSSGTAEMIDVPVIYGSVDRVVAAIKARNTQNQPLSIPMMSVYLKGLELAPERRKGVNFVHNTVVLQQGGVMPDDLKVVSRVMPIPYNAGFELSIYASNTIELHQILEQVLMLFDPILQIQLSDKTYDWTKLTHVELAGVNNEEAYPIADDKRILQWTLDFIVPIWINPPAEMKDTVVKTIRLLLSDSTMKLDQYDQEGNLIPFDEVDILGNIEVGAP